MSGVPFVSVGIAAETTITVVRESSDDTRPQGLVVDADQILRVGDTEATRVVLWNTTAPDTVEIEAEEAGEVRLWNVWRDGDLVQAWEGEAAIEVDDHGDDLGLRCRDGHPGSGFDLQVRVSFDRAWTQPSADSD